MRVSNCGFNFHHDVSTVFERPTGTEGHILMVIRSPGRIVVKDQEYFTKGNCVVLYHMDSAQYFYPHNTEFINDWVRFYLSEEDAEFWKNTGLQFDTIAEYADVYPLSRLIKIMATEKWSTNKNAEQSCASLLRAVLLKLSDYMAKNPVTYTQLTEKLTILRNNIYTTPHQEWTIDGICQSLSISPSYLQHKYKQFFGNSIKNDIIESRMQYSMSLLANTNHTISAIARMVGYSSDLAFLSIFKKKTGFTPSQYRISTRTYYG